VAFLSSISVHRQYARVCL